MQRDIIISNDAIQMALIALESVQEATYHHSVRTANIAVLVAKKVYHGLYLTPEEVRDAALLHDIGKLNVPIQILEKKKSLTAREMENVHHHPLWGERILLSMADQRLKNLARFVREHHELPDGTGYPLKLTLDEIDPVSRVINIADRYAAMTENRPYRKAVNAEFAIETLREDIKAFFPAEVSRIIDVLTGSDTESAKPYHHVVDFQAPAPAFILPVAAMAG